MENEYYGLSTTPTEDYLAHYGIKGMKWGVRKAIQRGNDRALGRQYRKAQKKLAKLEKRAASGKKYAKRAAALGAGAAAAGGLAAIGTHGVARGLRGASQLGYKGAVGLGGAMSALGNAAAQGAYNARFLSSGTRSALARAGRAVESAGKTVRGQGSTAIAKGMMSGANAVSRFGRGNSIASGAAKKYAQMGLGKATNATQAASQAAKYNERLNAANKAIGGVSNNTIARIGAGAIGAGLAGAAGYNAYRAATTKRAAAKAAAFRKEMNKQFAGTKYANAPRTPQKKRRRG